MIVEAVGIATAHGDNEPRTQLMADAMLEAVKKAQAEGIADPEIIRGLILEARDSVLNG